MNILDKAIGFFNPKAGFNRVANRARMHAMDMQIRRYEGAAEGRRHANWLMRNNPSVNQVVQKDLKKLVSRSRELTMNNPYARKAPIHQANNIVGTAIIPSPYIVDTVKDGRVKENSNKEEILKAVNAAWKEWATELNADHDGVMNFYGLQYLAIRTIVVSGEVLMIRKLVKTDVNKYGFQLLLLECDYIDSTKHNDSDTDGGYTFYGIKFDKSNKRAGYWIYDRHPSDGQAKSSFVKIDDIIHVYDVERAGQMRGVPFAASTLLKQRDLDDYEDAELLGKKAQACMPIFVTKNDVTGDEIGENEKIEDLEPGQINYLNSGENVTMASTPVSAGFGEYTKTQHRAVANGYLMTYEMFTGDLSNVNFSSGRMGALEYQKTVEYLQYQMFIPRFCDVVFAWFIDAARIAVGIDKDVKIKANWTAPRRAMLDPVKETTANQMAVRSGFTSWQNIVRENGYNPDEILADLIAAHTAFKDAGLMPESDPALSPQVAKIEADNNTAQEGQ